MKKRVLICDDDEEILFICSYVLEKQGFDVVTSDHCNGIVDIVKKAAPDVILMDNWIPASGGIIASQTIKADAEIRHIPIVYFSANSEIEELALQAGAEAYLPKPFELKQLETVIANLVK